MMVSVAVKKPAEAGLMVEGLLQKNQIMQQASLVDENNL